MRILILGSAIAALVTFSSPAAAQTVHGNSPKTDLHVSSPVVVGTQTLKPGDYKFQCIDVDGKHFLVVKDEDGNEVAKVPCEPQSLTAKVERSEFRSISRDGKLYVTAVHIKGESVAHRIVPNPAG